MVARLLPLRASFQHVLLFLHSLLVKRFPGTRVHGVHGLLSKRAERTRAGSRGFTVFTSTSAILRRPLCMNSTYTALSDFSNILPACRDAFYRRDYFQTANQTVAGTSGCRPVSSPVIEMIELLSNDTPILCSSLKKRMFPPFSSLTFRNSQWLVESELVVGLSNCLRNKN